MLLSFIVLTLHTLWASPADDYPYHHAVMAEAGDGALKLLDRYHLKQAPCNVSRFYELNDMRQGDPLLKGRKYVLPILIYRYNSVSIRSTIGDDDYDKAVRIQQYNDRLLADNLRRTSYRDSKILWVPHHEIHCADEAKPAAPVAKTFTLPLLGRDHRNIKKKSDDLKGQVFYLVAGHGGPDPGAVGKSGGASLCEDEYAYDVTLRLYKLLWEHGANAYMVIEDKDDGIRDDRILPCDKDEKCNDSKIPLNQRLRLMQRVNYVNALYHKHKKKGVKDQTFISIHVDSRSVNHRQDVFFCHYPTSKSSRQLAEKMQSTFAKNYRKHRRGGNYAGKVTPRSNLYVLKNTAPKAILIELANIQNKSDHQRILQASNRQALANWMLQGLL